MGNFLGKDSVTRDCWRRLGDHLQATFDLPPDADTAKQQYRETEGQGQGQGYTDSEHSGGASGGEAEYPEPEVDEMRAQRDVLLARYVMDMERREAMQARLDAQSGGGGDDGGGASDGNGNDAQDGEGGDGGAARSSKSGSSSTGTRKTKK